MAEGYTVSMLAAPPGQEESIRLVTRSPTLYLESDQRQQLDHLIGVVTPRP